jgi:hypothetical protein
VQVAGIRSHSSKLGGSKNVARDHSQEVPRHPGIVLNPVGRPRALRNSLHASRHSGCRPCVSREARDESRDT